MRFRRALARTALPAIAGKPPSAASKRKSCGLRGLSRDIDEPADLAALVEAKRGSARYAFLHAALRNHEIRRKTSPRTYDEDGAGGADGSERAMMSGIDPGKVLDAAENGDRPRSRGGARARALRANRPHGGDRARGFASTGHGNHISFSKKVFIPLTQLCADVCHYCTFAHAPRRGEAAYLSPRAVLDIARHGMEHGVKEALFTLGDKPERRYATARQGARRARSRDDARLSRSLGRPRPRKRRDCCLISIPA